jgi:hypothetical protein
MTLEVEAEETSGAKITGGDREWGKGSWIRDEISRGV